MAKRKKKAKPRRCRTVVQLPNRCDGDVDDIQVRHQKKLAPLYDGLKTKEEMLKRWRDGILAPIYDDETLITREHAKRLARWWNFYTSRILNDDHETAETVILKITTGAFIDTLTDLFTPERYRVSVLRRVYELIDGLGKAPPSTPHPSEPPLC